MKNISANTFTPIYDKVEDRLRLVVNYQDIQNRVDFMITRSFILNLVPAAEEFIDKHYSDNMESKNTLVEPITQNNEALSKTDGVNLELLRTSEELLLEVNFSFNPTTKQTIVTFTSKNIAAKTLLDEMMMKKTFDVIKSAIPHIPWGISHSF